MIIPPDFGPLSAETDLHRFPAEPWNTASNIIFIFIIIYFSRITKLDFQRYPLIVVSLPILTIGFIGGTVYHATRSHRIWLVMDWAPIMILSILASVYFIKLLTESKIKAILIPIALFIFMRVVMSSAVLPLGFKISIAYLSLASIILVPAYLTSIKFNLKSINLKISAVVFIIAVLFRYFDRFYLLPMGTHFLWHLCGGVSVWYLMSYILKIEENSFSQK